MSLMKALTLLGSLAFIFISSTTNFVSGDGSYVVLFPRIIHPGWPLNVAVSIHRTTQPGALVTVLATLVDKSEDVVARGRLYVREGESKLLEMQIPSSALESAQLYRLSLSGTGGLAFNNEESLQANPNSTVIAVQTDKKVYKPGQLVRFRIINLNKDLVPVSLPLTAFILNPKSNKLERYDNISSTNGVSSRDFQLSKFASLGLWHITLQNQKEDVLYHHSFEVDEYVLPKFSVEVKPDPDFLIWGIYNQPPGIVVTSMYTYGKAVQGECILKLAQKGNNNRQQLSQKIPESGIVEFTDINWSYLIGAKPSEKKVLLAQVEVKDVMGRTEYGEASINVFRGRYKVEILPQSPSVLHSGLETEIFVKVSDHNNVPVAGKEMRVTLRMPDMTPIEVTASMEEGQGYVVVRFTPFWSRETPQNVGKTFYGDLDGELEVVLVEDELVRASKEVFWFYSLDLQSIKFEGPRQIRVPIGQAHTLRISRTQTSRASTTMYTIVSQGIILKTGVVSGNELIVTPTFDFCPTARLVVYQLYELATPTNDEYKEEIIADAVDLVPQMCLDKQIQVKFDAREQRTGTDANLQINVVRKDGTSLPREVYDVFYMAVDKSIVLLQGDTSLTDQKIMAALDLTNSWNRDNTQNTAQSIFQFVDLAFMTNAGTTQAQEEWGYVMAMIVVPETEEMKETAGSQPQAPAKKIRKDFPDTWLWAHGKTTESGQFRSQVKLPDTITSWHVAAFGVSQNGIVGSGAPFMLTAFNPFFISLNLPYSIKRGEVFSLRVTVFNYRPQELTAIIRLERSDDFLITGGQVKDNYMEHAVNLLPNLASSVVYEITASRVGKIQFHVEAQDVEDVAQRDEIIKELIVKPPGEERDDVVTDMMILAEGQRSITQLFEVDWPISGVVEGSQRLQFKVTGQVLGQSLANLQKLVRQPTGCGEQNMIALVPNIYGATYIRETNQEKEEHLVGQMINNMRIGYQREVDLYQREDGSYSAWASDKEGSTWLTAFVMKSFAAASKFIRVEPDVLEAAISFMTTKQTESGYFKEDGRLLHKSLQKGTSSDLPLTVYCLLSILETVDVLPSSQLQGLLDNSLQLIRDSVSDILSQEGTFLPAMTAYTLSMAAKRVPFPAQQQLQELVEALLETMKSKSVPWEVPDSAKADFVSKSTAKKSPEMVMTAAYVLLTHLQYQDMGKAFRVMQWLQSQQNFNGGFGSTQDTVLALQSLAQFGIYYKDVDATGEVEVSVPGTSFVESLDISGGRSILLQQLDLPVESTLVNVTLTGSTSTAAFVKLVTFYNTPVTESKSLTPGMKSGVDIRTSNRYLSDVDHQVEACVTSTLELGVGMYVMTMKMASGEEPYFSAKEIMAMNPGISQVEFEDGLIHFYMNDIPEDGLCIKTILQNQMDFAVKQPGSARVYSYYEPEYYKESELAVVDAENTCVGGHCGSAPALSITSLVLTTGICFMTSLLACL